MRIVLSILFATLLFSFKCNKQSALPKQKDDTKETTYESILKDLKFENGFSLRSPVLGDKTYIDTLDYNGTAKGKPFWRVAQWACLNNNLKYADYKFKNNWHTYKVGNKGNMFAVNTGKGALIMELNASTEYGLNGITHNPRIKREPWPHLLVAADIYNDSKHVNISEVKDIRMTMNYTLKKFEDKMPKDNPGSKMHTAQFVWFITVINKNSSSPDFGKYFWFGFNLYDKRYDYAPLHAAQDNGKDDSTMAFIYMPGMEPILASQGKVELNKKMNFDVNVLPLIRKGFKEAQKKNYLKNSKWEDLYIGATNFGWEVTGTYDVSMEVDNVNIEVKIK